MSNSTLIKKPCATKHTRRDFIDPFFKALGWDIDNEQGYAEAKPLTKINQLRSKLIIAKAE